jgi:mannose-6-phosphate isomerase class I
VALAPVLLAPDNFTPPTRTPWGGQRIVAHYKAHLGLRPELREQPVGESWELSMGPELPSLTDTGEALPEVIARAPHALLGDEAESGGSALLVKWLDTADNLSVQIHPDVSDPKLASDETGKPECWYIVDREPGAGLYVGLSTTTTPVRMREALEAGGDVSSLLSFVAVEPGDFFLLAPGMPHAIGRNVTLIEPQYVACGKRGLTLRYWDWNRRYDAQGRQDAAGQPRPLQVERALEVTDWVRSSDPAWLAKQRCSLGPAARSGAAKLEPLCGPGSDQPVCSEYLRAARLSGDGELCLPRWRTLAALTVIEGEVELRGAFGRLSVPRGRTAALPAQAEFVCELRGAHALLSSVVARKS